MLKPGAVAPDFTLPAGDGSTVRLKDLRGKPVVLYFYPRDDTPGCTTQACGFRDTQADYDRAGALVFGISGDDARSHRRFADKYGLSFPLLSDPDHAVATLYDSWGLKKFMGREYMGIIRNTFLVDRRGRLARVWEKVKPAGHAEEVLEELSRLS
ncbi:MAG: thioredoxin-dependent peroxiredoxin [Chloroflexota bacterium]|nr:thioredoxin-dependent peroxiredoxin [Chloroflexota bacterium]